MCDDVVCPFGLLEDAVPVAVVTLLIREVTYFTRATIHRVHLLDDLAYFCSVGTDILDGSSTYLPGDEGEILHAVQTEIDQLCH